MKATFNETEKSVDFKFEKDDGNNLLEIRETLNAVQEMVKTEGYKKLEKYYKLAREQIIASGKRCSREESKRVNSSERWAMLDGFDQSILLPTNLIKEMEGYIERKIEKKEKEDDYGTGNEE